MGIAEVRAQVLQQGGWVQLFQRLAPELDPAVAAHRRSRSAHVACPVHGSKRGERGDGFRLFEDASQTGGAVCNSCGIFSDGFAVLAWLWSVRTPEVLRRVGEAVDRGSGAGHAMPRRRAVPDGAPAAGRSTRANAPSSEDSVASAGTGAEDDHLRRRAMLGLFEAALPLGHPDAELGREYLRSRGLPVRRLIAEADTLRFHPALLVPDEAGGAVRRHPGILAAFRAGGGEIVTLQRVFLTANGERNREIPKLALRKAAGDQLQGGAIRIGRPVAGHLGIAEGWETSAAVWQLSGIGCWAATGWALLESWEPPAPVHTVTIWADHDSSGRGQRSADVLATKLLDAGREVRIMVPPQADTDWADVLMDPSTDKIACTWTKMFARELLNS